MTNKPNQGADAAKRRPSSFDRMPWLRYVTALGIGGLVCVLSLLAMGFFSRDAVAQFSVDSGIVIGTAGDLVMPESAAYFILEGIASKEAVLESAQAEEIIHLSRIRILADALFSAGVLVAGVGGLIFVSQEGVFDGLVYSMKQFWWIFQVRNRGEKHESYHEYKERLGAKPKSRFGHLLIAGLILLLLGGLCVLWFEKTGHLG